jgi:hypothetical protein
MYRETLVPSEQQKCFIFPPDWYGKQVEITAGTDRSELWKTVAQAAEEDWQPEFLSDEEAAELMPGRIRERELASMTPEERKAEEERFSRRMAEWESQPELIPITGDWYRKWKTEVMGYDYGYYDRIYGKTTK